MRFISILFVFLSLPTAATAFPISAAGWSDVEWERHCKDVRTTYNANHPLASNRLTLTADDPRFLDFLYWVWANKILEHQVEQIGGTEWQGPRHGVIFHWAPGSRWETHTVASLEHAIHHIAEEHYWQDNMFKEFFQTFGPVQGVNIQKRLSKDSPPTWAQFLQHIGGPESMYYRYIFHQESSIDPRKGVVVMFGGQGVQFEYSYERYLAEAATVLTDCKAYQFFLLFDLYGKGFASKIGWAGQPISSK